MLFLPTEVSRTAAIEIALRTRQRRIRNECYKDWAEALGVRYWRVAGALTGGCNGGVTSRDNEAARAHKILGCNVTVDVMQFVGAVYRAAQETA